MAVVMMGVDDKKPIFHDFLAISCGNSPATVAVAAAAEVIATSAMETEASASAPASAGVSSIRHGLVTGITDPVSGPEASRTFSGRKRSSYDSAHMGFVTDDTIPACEDATESSRSLKMLGKEDEVQLPMQPPLRPKPLHSPLSSRPALFASKSERSVPMNPGSMPAADEGSMTGIKGCGALNGVASGSGPGEGSMARPLPCSSRKKYTQISEPESSNALRFSGMQNVGRQMTIFYAGQAHVFDDVHPNKAEVIMALAGSSGGSWSTTCLQKPEIQRYISNFPSI